MYSRQKHISKNHRIATKGLITILKSDTLIWVKTPYKLVSPLQTSPHIYSHLYLSRVFSEKQTHSQCRLRVNYTIGERGAYLLLCLYMYVSAGGRHGFYGLSNLNNML